MQHLSTPVLVTPRVNEQAAAQEISMIYAEEGTLNQVYDDTGRTEFQNNSAITIGASKRFGGDKPADAVLDGQYIGGGPRGKGERGDKGSVDAAHTIHLQIEDGKQITEADLAERLAETLLVPARNRRTWHSALGVGGLLAGTLFEATSYVIYNANDGEFTPGTWAWMASGAVALVGGAVEVGRGIVQGRRINAARRAAVVRRPIHLI
jgi:hypothetical protein